MSTQANRFQGNVQTKTILETICLWINVLQTYLYYKNMWPVLALLFYQPGDKKVVFKRISTNTTKNKSKSLGTYTNRFQDIS